MSLGHRPEIDGLRAIAILLVMAYHAGWGWPAGGFVGVDLFFVLSGYLITRLLVEALDGSGRIDLTAFYARRVLRLLPALVIVCGGVLLAAPYFLPPFGEVQGTAKSALAALLFAANLWFWKSGEDYFNPDSGDEPLLHLWSLGVEEQFYLCWPLALWLGWRWRGRTGSTALLLLVAALSLAAALYWTRPGNAAAFYLMPTRAWQFALGGLLALHQGPLAAAAARHPRTMVGAGLLGAGLLLLAAAIIRHGDPYPGWRALLPSVGGALLLLGLSAAGRWQRLLAWSPLAWTGARSYELYLWHWPLLVFAAEAWTDRLPPWLAGAVLALAFVLADLTRRAELGLRRRLARRAMAPAAILGHGLLATAALAVLALAVGGWAKYGWKSPTQQLSLEIAGDQPRPAVVRCMDVMQEGVLPMAQRLAGDCRLQPDDGPAAGTTWALWGDSHAVGWAEALLAQPGAPTLLLLGHAGCSPLDQYNLNPDLDFRNRCLALQRQALSSLEDLARTGGLSRIFLAARWSNLQGHPPLARSQAERERRVGYRWYSRDNEFARALQDTVGRLVATGVEVVLLESAPEFALDLPTCVYWRDLADCGVDRATLETYRAPSHQALLAETRRAASVRLFDPLPLLCGPTRCEALHQGLPVVSDDNHLATRWARRLAPVLAAWLQTPPPTPR